MKSLLIKTAVLLVLLDLGANQAFTQTKKSVADCKQASFNAYEEDERGRINDNGRKLRRIVYRWNGRFYARH
jgi:hypothetical protein